MSLLRRLARQVFAHRHTRCDFASATRESMRHQLVGPGTEIRRQDSEEVWPNRARAGAMAAPRPVALSPRLSVLYQLGMTKERNTELSICWGMGGPSRLGVAALRGSVLNASRPSERRKGRADENRSQILWPPQQRAKPGRRPSVPIFQPAGAGAGGPAGGGGPAAGGGGGSCGPNGDGLCGLRQMIVQSGCCVGSCHGAIHGCEPVG